MPLIIKQSDIFTSNADYLVCPVNCEGVMGKGLAKEFKVRFPECESKYIESCNNNIFQGVGITKIFCAALYDIGSFSHVVNANNVVFFATKKHWRNKSNLLLIKKGLERFCNIFITDCKKQNRASYEYKSYAFPALGCGEGGLNWEDVKAMFEEVFQNCENDIELYEPIK